MADKYYDYNNGNDADDGSTPALAKALRSSAVSASSAGDKVIAVDGDHAHTVNYFEFNDNRIESSESFRGATLEPEAAYTLQAARISGTITPQTIENLTFNGEANGGLTQAFSIINAGTAKVSRLHGCEFISGTSYGLLHDNRDGRLEIVSCKISGVLNSRYLGATASLSGDGNQVIDIQGLEIAPTADISGSKKAIELSQVATPTNTLDLYFKGLSATIGIAASAVFTLLDTSSKDTINIAGSDLTINADDAAGNVLVLLVSGNASTYETSDANLTNNTVNFNAPSGFAISFGLSTTDSHITGGVVSGNKVIGKIYASATPHNYVMGQGTIGELRGNQSIKGYVGYLISITDNCQAIGNLAYDCYGQSLYMKGTILCTVRDNVCVVSSAVTQRDRGIIAVAPQGATNTAGATVQENLVIVQDITKIHSLASIEDASQVCTFVRNTYIISDTVDVDGGSPVDLFSYETAGGAANNTLAEWNAQAEVTDDVIVQLPDSEISKLINEYKNQVKPKPDLMYLSGQGVRVMAKDFVL